MNQFLFWLIIVFLSLLFIGGALIHERDRLIYSSHVVCKRTPLDLGLVYKIMLFHKNTSVWLAYKEDQRIRAIEDEHLFVFIPGAASGKECSIALARNILSVNPNADLLLTEHPGVDGRFRPNRKDTLQLIKEIYMYVKKATDYRKITFVTSCIGLTFFLKALYQDGLVASIDPERESIIIVNGFIEWYKQPVSCPAKLDRTLGKILTFMVPYRFQEELNARKELIDLVKRRVPILCFQSIYNTHVRVEHGRDIEQIIGTEHYVEYPRKIQCYLDMKNKNVVDRLSQFCEKIKSGC